MYTQSHYKKYKSISFGDTDSSRPNYFARSWSNNSFKQKVVIKQWKTIINIGALRACFVVCFYVVSLCLLNVYLKVLKRLWEKKKIVLKLVLLRSRTAAIFFYIYLKVPVPEDDNKSTCQINLVLRKGTYLLFMFNQK